MGESIVDSPEIENKKQMGESAAAVPDLEVSVSFGRFENDSLSWEKWSSFSPNKYLEEVEKCSTPGSVAKKAAYFEAHYKKIAARKAELSDQKKQMETGTLSLDEPNPGDLIVNTVGTDAECDRVESQKPSEVFEQKTHGICAASITHLDEPNEDTTITKECQTSSVERAKEEFDSRAASPKLKKLDEADSVKEETCSVGSQEVTELSPKLDSEMGNASKVKAESVRSDPPKESPKITLTTKEGNATKVKKKSASPIPKSPLIPTPRVPKPASSSTVMSAWRSSTKKGTGSSLPRSNNPPARESKKAVPTSLRMSLSLGCTNSTDSPSLTTTRKSFIMEKMGDKDIVKRAFKTFQNNYNQLKTSGEQRSAPKQVSAKVTELRVSTPMPPRKENERSLKAGAVDQRSTKGVASSFGLRSDERAEKRKEFLKKLEEKSNAKEAERMRLRSKSKEEKEAEIKKLRQSLNFKATPMPDFCRGQRLSKSSLEKVGSKNEVHS